MITDQELFCCLLEIHHIVSVFKMQDKLLSCSQIFDCGLFAFVSGMLLAGFLIRNTPFVSDIIQINLRWSAALRNIALSIILTRAGLGLDPKVWHQLLQ